MGPLEHIETARLVLRKPTIDDAEAIFVRYASDPLVTKYLSWPRHRSLHDTRHFLAFSDAEWQQWPVGPYLVHSLADRHLLGGTGLHFESPTVAETGYVFARDAWGQGFATECLRAVIEVARSAGVQMLTAGCHPENAASRRVLEKCGFTMRRPGLCLFPNLTSEPQHTWSFALEL